MSTQSLIAARYGNKYKVIYCHFDGYLEGVGAMLEAHYQEQQKIDDLLNLGDISFLDEECTCPDGHSYSHPIDGYTIAYHRDRGTNWERVKPAEYASLKKIKGEMMRYVYVWQDSRWNVLAKDDSLTPLSNAISMQAAQNA